MENDTKGFVAIAVMGMTGAGKSTFIQKASGLDSVEVGHKLESCMACTLAYSWTTLTGPLGTAKPQDFRFDHGSKKVVLIDTPGFDDTNRNDGDVLSDIGFFLAKTYENGVRLSGIIYLHDITKNRMTHGGLSNLIMFQDLCGPEPLGNVVLATSRWSKDPEQLIDQERFERELRTNPKYWGEMVAQDSKVTRFANTKESAHEILDILIPKEKVTLAIQEEMVKENRPIGETTAGRTLNNALVDLRKELEEQMQKQIEAALQSQNEAMKIYRKDQAKKYEQKILKLREQQERLHADDRTRRREFDQMMDQMAIAKVEKEVSHHHHRPCQDEHNANSNSRSKWWSRDWKQRSNS